MTYPSETPSRRQNDASAKLSGIGRKTPRGLVARPDLICRMAKSSGRMRWLFIKLRLKLYFPCFDFKSAATFNRKIFDSITINAGLISWLFRVDLSEMFLNVIQFEKISQFQIE